MIKIVLVEDLPIIQEGIKVLINQIPDFKVVAEYNNGQEFIENLDNFKADIILTDIDMPIMDGITATKKALAKYPDLNIIALTMYNDQKYYYEMITAGSKGFVLKQASTEELELAIREVYKGKQFFSENLLHSVILNMQNIEKRIVDEKKALLELTDREIEILTYICKGLTNKELSDKLYVSVKTIESNKTRLMKKINARNTAGLIIWAIKNKIIKV